MSFYKIEIYIWSQQSEKNNNEFVIWKKHTSSAKIKQILTFYKNENRSKTINQKIEI